MLQCRQPELGQPPLLFCRIFSNSMFFRQLLGLQLISASKSATQLYSPMSVRTRNQSTCTCTFMEGSFLVFSRSGRRLMLMLPPLWRFPGAAMLYVQGHYIWSNVSHDKPCAFDYSASLGDSVSSPSSCGWDHHTCSRQIYCAHSILKVFVWGGGGQFCGAFVVSHDSSCLG